MRSWIHFGLVQSWAGLGATFRRLVEFDEVFIIDLVVISFECLDSITYRVVFSIE